MFDDNKRKCPRANYPCQITVWRADGGQDVILANTSNISAGGLCVYLNQDFLPGVRMQIKVDFTGSTTPFKCKAVVVRSERHDEQFFKTAVQFEGLDDVRLAFLEGKISELIALEKKAKG